MALLPRILDVVGDRNIPVVAAGSISDARGYVAALSMGAKGICVGTRLVHFTTSFLFYFRLNLNNFLTMARYFLYAYSPPWRRCSIFKWLGQRGDWLQRK